MRVNTKPSARGAVPAVLGWAQRCATGSGSRPPRVAFHTFTLLCATYWGSAGCARPQYVAHEHASLQSPVTLGEGNTGKPALDQLPAEGGRPAAPPPVHPPSAPAPSGTAGSPAPSGTAGSPAPSGTAAVPEPDPVGRALGITPATEAAPDAADPSPAGAASSSFDPRTTPDPALASTGAYYELTLRYCEAGVHLLGARRVVLKRPTTLPRLMGRFAAELWIGHELLERDRFDFPLVAADPVAPDGVAPARQRKEPPPLQLGPRADVVWKVKVADRVRATQAWIIDRATGERWLLDWPPATSRPKPTADAPCPSFGGK